MQHEQVIADFWKARAFSGACNAARYHAAHTPFDQAVIAPLIKPKSHVLDLGCGTCDIANWLVSKKDAAVCAVDGQAAFLAHAIDDPRLTTHCCDVRVFEAAHEAVDVALLLEVVQHITSAEALSHLYAGIARALKMDGTLVLKCQFGRDGAVAVRGYSAGLGMDHLSVYPSLADERDLVATEFDVRIVDAYPPEFSPHRDTAFYHLIGTKRR